MKTSPVTPADLQRSVLAVPPLPRKADLSINTAALKTLAADLRAGGVSTFMWGGNANLYNMGVKEFASFCRAIIGISEPGDWMIPSIGADFGKAMDQVEMLRDHPFPTAMILPMRFPSTPKGVAVGVAKIAARYGKPLILYIKDDGYIAPMDCAALIKDGAVTVIKYGTVRQHPADDPFLGELTGAVDPMRIISGIGERPVIEHFSSFGLRAFTSGCVCIAPRLSMLIREHLLAGRHDAAAALRQEFLRMEDLRDTYSPLRVLHQAVGLAGICETGPMQPFLSDIDDADALSAIKSGAQALRAKELAARQRHAA